MTAESPDTLLALLAELRRIGSPTERLRRVARAWRHVRALSPDERARLADAVGIEGAERVIERLSGRKIPVADLIRSIAATSDDDPGSVRRLVGELGDPDGRREVLRRARERVATRIAQVPLAPDPGAEPGPGTDGEPAIDGEPGTWPVDPPAAGRPVVADDVVVAERADEDDREQESIATVPVAPVAAPVAPLPARTATAVPTPVPVETPAAPVVPRSGSGRTVIESLRELRVDLEAGGLADPATIAERIDAFPPGWARRRAVLAAIDAGAVGRLRELEPLLDLLGGPADRRWCTLALVDRGAPTSEELRGLAMGSADPSVRRRAARVAAGARN